MKLGILLNSDKFCQILVGLTRTSVGRGHEVIIFAMDDGVKLLENKDCTQLSELDGVNFSYCDHNVQQLGVKTGGLSEKVESSSQYSNAAMNHQADKVIVL